MEFPLGAFTHTLDTNTHDAASDCTYRHAQGFMVHTKIMLALLPLPQIHTNSLLAHQQCHEQRCRRKPRARLRTPTTHCRFGKGCHWRANRGSRLRGGASDSRPRAARALHVRGMMHHSTRASYQLDPHLSARSEACSCSTFSHPLKAAAASFVLQTPSAVAVWPGPAGVSSAFWWQFTCRNHRMKSCERL
jgi:hypothetical protein